MVSGGLFEARRDFSELFELVEEPLHEVASSVDRGVDGPLNLSIPLCRNVTAPAPRGDQIEDGTGVATPVGDDVARRGMCGKERLHGRLVGGLAGRQRDRDRQAPMIDHGVDLGTQSTTRTAEGVIRPPFSAAACGCARMIEESMDCMLAGDFSARVSNT